VVGDDDQAIYSWRGANIRFLFDFESDFSGTQVLRLERNYRSTKPILDFANQLIGKNILRRQKAMWTEKKEGAPVFLLRSHSKEEEASKVADLIIQLNLCNPEVSPIGVLYRINSQSLAFESEFSRRGISFKIFKGLRFFERKEVKDSLALLKLAIYPEDDISFLRLVDSLPLGVGSKTLDKLTIKAKEKKLPLLQALKQFLPDKFSAKKVFKKILELNHLMDQFDLSEMLSILLENSGYLDYLKEREEESRILNIRELLNFISNWEATHEDEDFDTLLDRISLDSKEKSGKGEISVYLMTMHNAKGLEFPTVIVTGVNGSYLPFFMQKSPSDREEERRLFYVASTRAIHQLVISTGSDWPSVFMQDIPADLYHSVDSASPILDHFNQESILDEDEEEGCYLQHPVFGKGKIQKKIDADRYLVNFSAGGEKLIDISVVPVTFL
jgi:DNA helicase-2/ATP-dependent DNA helicase PcrA